MIDMKLMREYFTKFVPDAAKIGTSKIFDSYSRNPVGTLTGGLAEISHTVFNDNKEISATAVNAMLFGFLLGAASEKEELKNAFIEGFLEYYSKQNSENVVDFLQAKAKKGY